MKRGGLSWAAEGLEHPGTEKVAHLRLLFSVSNDLSSCQTIRSVLFVTRNTSLAYLEVSENL